MILWSCLHCGETQTFADDEVCDEYSERHYVDNHTSKTEKTGLGIRSSREQAIHRDHR